MGYSKGTNNCERCGENLNPKTMVGLELETSTGQYHRPGKLPPEKSQGLFYFGKACAKAVLANNGYIYYGKFLRGKFQANSLKRR